jgi:cell division GTPase FtsZ
MKTTTTTIKTPKNNKIFHFIGLGGAGSNLVELIYKKGLQGKYTIITDPERRVLTSDINFIKYVPNAESTRLMSERRVIKLADYEHFVLIPTKVKDVFKNEDNYVLIAGLGAYTGTLLTVALTKILQENKKPFIIVCSLPFDFEEKRQVFANEVKERLQNSTNFHYFDLNTLRKDYGKLPIKIMMEKAQEELYNLVENNLIN